MTDKIVLTDPARELAELCSELQVQAGEPGEQFLAAKFGVEPWSREFFQIVFTVAERCDLVRQIVSELDDLDDDLKEEIVIHIRSVMRAFSAKSMKNGWASYGAQQLNDLHIGPIKAVSGSVRRRVAYRKLSLEELSELDGQVSTLSDWLQEQQLSEQDFIRQALIEGLEQFRFRLSRLKWLGWGYTLDSLREVIAAYMLLERGEVSPQKNPDAAAVLKKVGSFIKNVYEKVGVVKEATEKSDWLLKAYGAGTLFLRDGPGAISGLLGNG